MNKTKILLATLISATALVFAGTGVGIGYAIFNNSKSNEITIDELKNDLLTKYTCIDTPEKPISVKNTDTTSGQYTPISVEPLKDFCSGNPYSWTTTITGTKWMNTDQMISYGSFFAYFNDTAPFKTGKILKQHQNTTSNINIENYTYESNYKIDNYFVDFYNVMYYTHISLSFVETNSSITNNTDGSKILFNDISNAGNIFVPSLCANSFSGSSFDDLWEVSYVLGVIYNGDFYLFLLHSATTFLASTVISLINNGQFVFSCPTNYSSNYFMSKVIDMDVNTVSDQ